MVVALSVNIGLFLGRPPSNATILQPVVNIGRSLNILRMPPLVLVDDFLDFLGLVLEGLIVVVVVVVVVE